MVWFVANSANYFLMTVHVKMRSRVLYGGVLFNGVVSIAGAAAG